MIDNFKIYCGDAIEVLKTLADESIQCCVTSPPYFGLRDYGTAKWEGVDEKCDHRRMSNKRSVWTITTKPFKGMHFATFPSEIPKICILAGSKKGDTILDPFCGAGTTGEVALRLGRNFIGIELNEKYVTEIIEPRLAIINPLFANHQPNHQPALIEPI